MYLILHNIRDYPDGLQDNKTRLSCNGRYVAEACSALSRTNPNWELSSGQCGTPGDQVEILKS